MTSNVDARESASPSGSRPTHATGETRGERAPPSRQPLGDWQESRDELCALLFDSFDDFTRRTRARHDRSHEERVAQRFACLLDVRDATRNEPVDRRSSDNSMLGEALKRLLLRADVRAMGAEQPIALPIRLICMLIENEQTGALFARRRRSTAQT